MKWKCRIGLHDKHHIDYETDIACSDGFWWESHTWECRDCWTRWIVEKNTGRPMPDEWPAVENPPHIRR